jgi:WS/DGAT/MGAT family acyltransferase
VEKLSFLDAAFLRMESAARPFHVAGLMIFKLPEDAPPQFLRRLARQCSRLNELWPVFDKKLSDPDSLRNPSWRHADDYDPKYHVFHYALPAPGRNDDLLTLVSRAHERLLDRHRPLWELHLIEGLSGGRFALYCKVHHALIDGVGALRMVDAMFSTSPDVAKQFDKVSADLKKHYKALPEVSSMIAAMGWDAWQRKKDVPPLPFTAPHSIFNGEVDARRQLITTELPLRRMRALGESCGGTINDALVAVCGGALREYLVLHNALPKKTLEAGVPMSIKRDGDSAGNQVAFIICPFHTELSDPLQRLRRIVKVTRKAKQNMRDMSKTAAQDYANALMAPTILLTLTGNTNRVNPALNAIVSNVPGSREQLYLDGAPMERLYPMSVVTDGMGINLTVISYMGKLCFAITSCPTQQPGIEEFAAMIKRSYRDLADAVASQ